MSTTVKTANYYNDVKTGMFQNHYEQNHTNYVHKSVNDLAIGVVTKFGEEKGAHPISLSSSDLCMTGPTYDNHISEGRNAPRGSCKEKVKSSCAATCEGADNTERGELFLRNEGNDYTDCKPITAHVQDYNPPRATCGQKRVEPQSANKKERVTGEFMSYRTAFCTAVEVAFRNTSARLSNVTNIEDLVECDREKPAKHEWPKITTAAVESNFNNPCLSLEMKLAEPRNRRNVPNCDQARSLPISQSDISDSAKLSCEDMSDTAGHDKGVKATIRATANTVDVNLNMVNSTQNSKRRESTSPDEGIAYSPAEIDDSPTVMRRNKLPEVKETREAKPDTHIEITIEGGLQREIKQRKKISKQSKGSLRKTSMQLTETSGQGKEVAIKAAKDRVIDRAQSAKTRKKRGDNQKLNKMSEKNVAKNVVKNALIENSMARKNKPVWVEITKKRSDPSPLIKSGKSIQKSDWSRLPKHSYEPKSRRNNDETPRKIKHHDAKELKTRNRYDKDDMQRRTENVQKYREPEMKNKKRSQRYHGEKSRDMSENAPESDMTRDKNLRTLRHRVNCRTNGAENATNWLQKKSNGDKTCIKHRSVSADSSVRDLSYSSSSSESYSSSFSSKQSYSSSATSGTHSVSASSTSAHSSGSLSLLSSTESTSSSTVQPSACSERRGHQRTSKKRQTGKSDEKLSSKPSPYVHRYDAQIKINGANHYGRPKGSRPDKAKLLQRRHSHDNTRKHTTEIAEPRVEEHRISRKDVKDGERGAFEDDQEFEVNLERRRNRTRRRPVEGDETSSTKQIQKNQWQHQRLVMTSFRPATGNARSSEKKQTIDTVQPLKQKSFEATAKDGAASALTIRDLYSLHHVLSDTQNGTVIAGHRRNDSMRVAIKRIAKSGTTRWGWMNGKVVPLELALICQVNEARHPGVVEIVEWHETTEAFLLVMVRPHPSVDLYDYVTKQKRLKEPVARRIIRQLVLALLHCQKMGVLHRDVKLENILFNPDTRETILIDFGCGDYNRAGVYKEFAGTPEYYPPEWFLCKQYSGDSATVWSVGVLLYSLLCGTLPFRSSKDIISKELTKYPSEVSRVAKHLIGETLRKNPRERIGVRTLLEHPWFKSSKDHVEDRKASA